MIKDKERPKTQIRDLSDIDDVFIDLKVRQPYIYNILNIYNRYICHYNENLINDMVTKGLKDTNCMCFERRDIKDHVTNKGKESLLSEEYMITLAELFPSIDLALERDRFIDWKRAKGVRHKNVRAAFRNWLRKAVEMQARYGEIKRPVRKYEDLFPNEEE